MEIWGKGLAWENDMRNGKANKTSQTTENMYLNIFLKLKHYLWFPLMFCLQNVQWYNTLTKKKYKLQTKVEHDFTVCKELWELQDKHLQALFI